jgi:uncharacterized protein
MRGRALETVITPLSFREFLRGRGSPVHEPGHLLSAAERSVVRAAFDAYLETGGFPEAVAVASLRELVGLLQGYVDTVLFRDVAERHNVSNLPALRAIVRHLLGNPATTLSISKLYADFRSRGIAVSKESLLEYMDHLEDAFLVTTLTLADRSERRRQVNPRKLYLSDHALAQAFSPVTGLNRGRLIENIVACELGRTSRELAYVKTASGFEVDFLATDFAGRRRLVQVAADISAPMTWEREIRALTEARKDFPDAESLLVYETEPPVGTTAPAGIELVPVWRFLTDGRPG